MARKAAGSGKKRGNSGRARKPRVEFQGYVNRNISAEEKELYVEAVRNGFNAWDSIESLILEGYSVKLGYDTYNDAFVSTLYAADTSMENAGWCLSYRGNTADASLSRLIFVHVYVLQGSWSDIQAPRDNDQW